MKSKLKAAWLKIWAKTKPWLESKSKAVGALIGGEVGIFASALILQLLGNAVNWNDVFTAAATTLFTAFGLTYFAPANKPLG